MANWNGTLFLREPRSSVENATFTHKKQQPYSSMWASEHFDSNLQNLVEIENQYWARLAWLDAYLPIQSPLSEHLASNPLSGWLEENNGGHNSANLKSYRCCLTKKRNRAYFHVLNEFFQSAPKVNISGSKNFQQQRRVDWPGLEFQWILSTFWA